MKATTTLLNILACLCAFGFAIVQSQSPYTESTFTDSKSGVILNNYIIHRSLAPGGLEFGVAFPAKLDKPDYIGRIVGPKDGWTGVSHNGEMINNLLLVAWADGNVVRHSFRYATAFNESSVKLYQGSSRFVEISHNVNSTHFEVIYRCVSCFVWDFKEANGSQPLNSEFFQFGFAQSGRKLPNPKNSDTLLTVHEVNGPIVMDPKKAAKAKYDSWAITASPRVVQRRQIISTVTSLPKISPPPTPLGLPKSDAPKLPIPVSTLQNLFRRQQEPSKSNTSITLPKISPPLVPPGLPIGEAPKLPIPVSTLGSPPLDNSAQGDPLIVPATTGIFPVPISPTAPTPPGLLPTNLPVDKESTGPRSHLP